MRTTGLVADVRFRDHDPGPHHPECPQRLEVLDELFATPGCAELVRIDARPAEHEEIERVHTPELVASVALSDGEPYTRFDPDTAASAGSFLAARLAAGGAIDLADAVCDGSVANGFAALRPPGHHAERGRAMGFCFFNNVAIVARHLQARRGLEKVLILDWDVHHGNGSQHSFYDDPSVMYASLHQYPFYPGSGAADEVGSGAGAGRTVNVPMPAGAADGEYVAAFREIVVPTARAFDPDFVLVSAGFDAHRDDPLAQIALSSDAYRRMANAIVGVADECCDGRCVLLLEGGYSLAALRDSVAATLSALRDPQPFDDDEGELTAWGRAANDALASYWNI